MLISICIFDFKFFWFSFNYIDVYIWIIILLICKFYFVVIIFFFFIWILKCKNDLICYVFLLVLYIVDIFVYEYLWSIINFYYRYCNNILSIYYIYDINSRCVLELKYNGKGGKVGEGGGVWNIFYNMLSVCLFIYIYRYVWYVF